MDLHDKEMTISDAVFALQWQIEMGADEALSDLAVDRYALVQEQIAAKAAAAQQIVNQARNPQTRNPQARNPQDNNQQSGAVSASSIRRPTAGPASPGTMPLGTAEAIDAAKKLVAPCQNLDQLKQAISQFDGLGTLKSGATNMVFGDGNPNADLMIIGEVPEKDDDRSGIAFDGHSGQLLNKMFSAIQLDRSQFFASHLVFWRPGGGSTPSDGQFEICKIFIEKQIELIAPKTIICLGSKPAQILFGQTGGISRIRGKWFENNEIRGGIKGMAIFPPAYLLKNPVQKRLAWRDLLAIQAYLT